MHVDFLMFITQPTVVYVLLLLGIYGIFFELFSPGFIMPGVLGVIALLLALYGLHLLPVNYIGLWLIIIGIVLIFAEAFSPNFGILGISGTLAFIFGSLILIENNNEGYKIAWAAITAMAVVNIIVMLTLLRMAFQSRKKPLQHGLNILIGARGQTLSDINLHGQAVIRGEIWAINATKPIAANKPVQVIAVNGLDLLVEEIDNDTKKSGDSSC